MFILQSCFLQIHDDLKTDLIRQVYNFITLIPEQMNPRFHYGYEMHKEGYQRPIAMQVSYPLHHIPQQYDSIRVSLDRNSILNEKMSQKMLRQLGVVFKIQQNFISEPGDRMAKIKGKIIDIFNEQKQHWREYMSLSKFKNLTSETRDNFLTIMENTWEDIKNKNKIPQPKPKPNYTRYICSSKNPKEIQQFHCSMLAFIKTGYFMEGYPDTQMMRHSNMGNYHMIPPQSNEFPQYKPTSSQHDNENQFNQPEQFFNRNMVKMEEGANYNPQYSSQMMYPNKETVYGEQNLFPKQEYFPVVEDVNNSTDKKVEEVEKKKEILDKDYNNCVCKGRFLENQPFFSCDKCLKKYHFKCLGIPATAKPKKELKICPLCSLTNNSVFYQTIDQPLDLFWTDDRELHKQKITIKGRKCKELLSKKQFIQLKFTKVQGKSYFEFDDNQQQPAKKNQQQKKVLLNEILINEEIMMKSNSDDIKISLDCMKTQNKPFDPNKKPVLLFFLIHVVRYRTKQQILEIPFENTEGNYLDICLGDKQEIKIQIIDGDLKLINIPARGSDCEHPGIFDLEEFISHSIELKSQMCFVCSKKCRNFKVDKRIAIEIAKIKEEIDNPDQYPSEIYYSRNGFRWNKQTKQEGNSPVIDSISLGGMSAEIDEDDDDDEDDEQEENQS